MTDVEKSRTVLSLRTVLDECTVALDEVGADGLSVRELARRLGAGTGSIYWWVKGKDELIDLAVDRVVEEATAPVAGAPEGEPLGTVRLIALRLFDAFDEHQWCPGRFVQNPQRQPHSVRALDLIGQQVARLGLSLEQQFHAATAVMVYVVGSCAQMANAQKGVGDAVSRAAHLAEAAARWDELDLELLPFLHAASHVLREHDDRDQFAFGLDLILGGIRELAR